MHATYNRAVSKTVLIIEDEIELASIVRDYLEQAHFAVDFAADGVSGLSIFHHRRPDLVLLDLNLPRMDGLDVAREIRRAGNTPLIMVTARVEETDRLIGLEIGADDYITKPFSPREVVARVKAVLRRASAEPEQAHILRVLDLKVDLDRHAVTRAEQTVGLTPTEFALLAALAAQPGRVFTRAQLLDALEKGGYSGYERTVDAHIKNLRAKLEPDPRQPRYVQTVFGVGYRFADG
jgi:DNA-binding response OmpR family regulator